MSAQNPGPSAAAPIRVEIWSDVMCPFCYLGKRQFDRALEAFPERDRVEVTWRSFLLQPDLVTDTSLRVDEFLSRERGYPREQVRAMQEQLTERGREEGIQFAFDRSVVANTRKAHALLHAAAEQGRQHALEERLFEAHFRDGRNVDDIEELLRIGAEAGLDLTGLREAILHGAYDEAVEADLTMARRFSIRGVPFFLFEGSFAVSGAQGSDVFRQALERAAGR